MSALQHLYDWWNRATTPLVRCANGCGRRIRSCACGFDCSKPICMECWAEKPLEER